MTTHRSMFEGGLGLPLMAIGWSIIISVAGCWAWLETANLWAYLSAGLGFTRPAEPVQLTGGYIGHFLMASFALLAQWTANFAILRVRRGSSRWLILAYAICVLTAAVSLHHVYEAMQAPAWRAHVEARTDAREPDTEIVTTNQTFLARVQERTLTLNTDTVSRRNESVSAPMLAEAQRAERAIAAAQRRLAAIPELDEKRRPWDMGDTIAAVLALTLAFLELTLYWGIGSPNRAADPAKDAANDKDGSADSAPLDSMGEVIELRPGAKGPLKKLVEPEVVKVGEIAFARNTNGRPLLDELEKAGLIDRSAVWSKVNSYPRAGARKRVA